MPFGCFWGCFRGSEPICSLWLPHFWSPVTPRRPLEIFYGSLFPICSADRLYLRPSGDLEPRWGIFGIPGPIATSRKKHRPISIRQLLAPTPFSHLTPRGQEPGGGGSPLPWWALLDHPGLVRCLPDLPVAPVGPLVGPGGPWWPFWAPDWAKWARCRSKPVS